MSGFQLGIALNETLSKPGGRIRRLRMYPMDFEEFLWANGVGEDAISTIRSHFEASEALDESSHNYIMLWTCSAGFFLSKAFLMP